MLNRLQAILSGFFKKPMKVGFISYYYPIEGKPMTGGIEVHLHYLSRELARLGCEVHVFTLGNKDNIEKKRIGEGKLIIHRLKTIITNVSDQVVAGRLNLYTFESRALNAVLYENKKRKFDIIHTQRWAATAFILKHFEELKLNWIHTFHSLDKIARRKMAPEDQKVIRIHEWVDQTVVDADKIIVVSEKFRQEIIKEIKGIARKTIVIPNGVDLEMFVPKSKNPTTVLYVGRFSKEKGIHLLPEIVDKVLKKSKKYKFIILVSDVQHPKNEQIAELKETKEKLQELAKKYPNQFTLISEPKTREEIAKLYHESSIYIQLSLYETFGMTVLEAMASGNATIVSNVGGMPELVGKAGIVVKPNSKDFTNKIIKLLKDSGLRKKYGKRAIERAKSFDWKIIAQRTLDLYNQIINEKKLNIETKKNGK